MPCPNKFFSLHSGSGHYRVEGVTAEALPHAEHDGRASSNERDRLVK